MNQIQLPADPRQLETLASRFWAKVEKQSGGCWLWTAGRVPDGYGKFSVGGRSAGAHRVAYQLVIGVIPHGLTLDHLCRNRACVNPSHLEPVARDENILRGFAPPAINARKAYCSHGHALIGGNVYIKPNGYRDCRRCIRERSRRYRRRVSSLGVEAGA